MLAFTSLWASYHWWSLLILLPVAFMLFLAWGSEQ